MRTFYEFFAGGGMAREGLGRNWRCSFANDLSPMKVRTYIENWGGEELVEGDIGLLQTEMLPGSADLAWASFPCQDLSLAGKALGLGERSERGETRSGTFWPFWSLMEGLQLEGRGPRLIVLENVVGAITSNNGNDFKTLCETLLQGGYIVGPIIVNAAHFVPQSRPRLFIVAVQEGTSIPARLLSDKPSDTYHSAKLIAGLGSISPALQSGLVWWSLPKPARRNSGFIDLIEDEPSGCRWHTEEETRRLIGLMTPLHRQKIRDAIASGKRCVGGVYKRTRADASGQRRQRAEVRFDDVAGCLRTPAGGSSRQQIIVIDRGVVRSRLLSPREAARLMGLSEDYILPARYNDAYHVVGDGVCVPVVRFLASHLLEPILDGGLERELPAAA